MIAARVVEESERRSYEADRLKVSGGCALGWLRFQLLLKSYGIRANMVL